MNMQLKRTSHVVYERPYKSFDTIVVALLATFFFDSMALAIDSGMASLWGLHSQLWLCLFTPSASYICQYKNRNTHI